MAEVGKAEVRVDAFDKATGRTKYYEDLMPRDALYVRIKHATIAHGFVKSVDTSAAEQIPGVVKVLTCFDVPEHPFPTAGHPWSMDPGHQDVADRHLLNRHVRYYGDDVAVVIAENEVAAMQGVRALKVEYEELPFVLNVQKAMEPDAPQLHEGYPGNILKHTDMRKGNYAEASTEDKSCAHGNYSEAVSTDDTGLIASVAEPAETDLTGDLPPHCRGADTCCSNQIKADGGCIGGPIEVYAGDKGD